MAIQVYTNCMAFYGGYNFTSYSNEISLDMSVEMKDSTVYGSSYRTHLAGFTNVTAAIRGFWDAGTEKPDDKMFAQIGSTYDVLTLCPTDGTAGARSFFIKAVAADYSPSMQLGEIINYSANFQGQSTQVCQGTILKNAAVTATGNGTAYQVGAVSAAQYLYAALHVYGVSGTATPTVTVTIESDDNESMTSATTRATFTAATAIGAEWATPVAGAITDDWWRATWTVSGTDPSLDIIVVMGIK